MSLRKAWLTFNQSAVAPPRPLRIAGFGPLRRLEFTYKRVALVAARINVEDRPARGIAPVVARRDDRHGHGPDPLTVRDETIEVPPEVRDYPAVLTRGANRHVGQWPRDRARRPERQRLPFHRLVDQAEDR